MELVRKYLNYIIFGAVVLLVVGLAVNHSRHMRYLVDTMAYGADPKARAAAAEELIKGEQFMDSVTGEPIETRVKAAEALEVLGNADAVTQAVAFLKDPDKPVRDRVVLTLEHIGDNSPDNIKALVAGLKDGDPYVRKGTITALDDPANGIGPRPGVVAAVVAQMKADGAARGPGGDVLGSPKFTQNGADKESVPLLLAQLKDSDEGVRAGAADALGKIGDPSAIPALVQEMHQDTAQLRRIAIGAIALIADKSGEAALTEAIDNPNDDNAARAQAAAGLGKIGTPSAIATLIKALGDDDLNLRSAVVAALARAGRSTPDAPVNTRVLASLTEALHNASANVRLGAAQALQSIAAPEADRALAAILTNPSYDARERAAAATALGFPGNKAGVSPLIAALHDTSDDVASTAEQALAKIGPDATQTLLALIQKGGTDAYYASEALGHQSDALPSLQKAAQSPNPVEQRWVAVALGDMGVSGARQTLEQLAKSSDPDVAYVAKEQLDRMGRTP
ncbi:MAG TPA: HEAT repeat domain-containing protein [Chthonomonadaceae bacterium]|nr:HEAT repeat domain-containing protein [Chthonomonadaceae bacterium]